MTIEIDGVNNTLKTDKIEPQSGTALQVGASGDTITLPSGATLNIAGTITNSGTATGFGAVDWQTSDIKTSTFTAVAGKGYFVNTTGGAVTVNLPAGSAGSIIALVDYAGTWDSNNCTVSANGSDKIQGSTDDAIFSRDREALQLVYVDSTQGWLITSVADQGGTQATYIVASGGTETTDGDFKVHTFNSTGTFTVSAVGNASGSNTIDYLVIAGGGGGGGSGGNVGGGGGAGAYQVSATTYCGPSLASGISALPVSAQAYPVTIGGGGSAGTGGGAGPGGASGANSVFSTITSAGGGRGGCGGETPNPSSCGPSPQGATPSRAPGNGSGGGGAGGASPGAGQPGGPFGNDGGGGAGSSGGGGGGGGAGSNGASAGAPGTPAIGGGGGSSDSNSITGSPVGRAAGGSGVPYAPGGNGSAGGSNTGNGGGGSQYPDNTGGNGGSGVVIIRYKYQN